MPSTLDRWCGSAPLASSSSTVFTWRASTATSSPVLPRFTLNIYLLIYLFIDYLYY
jgi:hypothetical protein